MNFIVLNFGLFCLFCSHSSFTTKKSFGTVLQEMTGIANQHEIVADNLASNVVKELQVYISELKDERKKHFKDAKQEEQALNTSVNRLEKVGARRGKMQHFLKFGQKCHQKMNENGLKLLHVIKGAIKRYLPYISNVRFMRSKVSL